jgi:hypothetical protein
VTESGFFLLTCRTEGGKVKKSEGRKTVRPKSQALCAARKPTGSSLGPAAGLGFLRALREFIERVFAAKGWKREPV